MPYKISGTKSATARMIIFKESDWSIESNTVISGSGSYEVDNLVSGNKLVVAKTNEGELLGYGAIAGIEYAPPGKAVYGGGTTGSRTNTLDYFTIGTLGNAQDFGDLTSARNRCSAVSNGPTDRGVWISGSGSTSVVVNIMDYITISTAGNATDFGDVRGGGYARATHAGTSNGVNDRGVFGGGYNASISTVNHIDRITISTTGNSADFGDLTMRRKYLGACSNGTNNRGVFYPGNYTGTTRYNVLDYINISSTGNAVDFGDSDIAYFNTGTSNGTNNRGILAGGHVSNLIHYITITSTGNSTDFGDLLSVNRDAAATSNTTYERGVVAGGWDVSNTFNTIQYITISTLSDAVDFGDLTLARRELSACSNA